MRAPAPRRPHPWARTLAATALTLLAGTGLSACTSDAAPPTGSTTATGSTNPGAFPGTVQGDNGPVTLAVAPTRIVSLSPTGTEMLFAIGAGPQVTAVDDQSDYPDEAPRTKLSGFKPNVEAITGYRPDLVLVSNDQDGIVGKLTALRVPVLMLGSVKDLDGSYRQIQTLGAATGHVAAADTVTSGMRARLNAAAASTPRSTQPLTVFHELDQNYYTATSGSFIGSVYNLLGLRNIADAGAVAGNDFPQLTSEAIVAANPDVVVLADTVCCQQTATTVAARPGWSQINAVKTGTILEADDDIASRWGPRVADFAELVSARLRASSPAPAR